MHIKCDKEEDIGWKLPFEVVAPSNYKTTMIS